MGTIASGASVGGGSNLAKSSKPINLPDEGWEVEAMIFKESCRLALQKASMGGQLGEPQLL